MELDWVMGGVLFALLIINCFRMWRFTMFDDHTYPIPLSAYLHNLLLLPLHFFTQKRYRECDDRKPWAIHLVLMLSYVTMLVLIMFFLRAMQYGPEIRWLCTSSAMPLPSAWSLPPLWHSADV